MSATLQQFLQERFGRLSLSQETIDLERFLQQTNTIELSSAERLRKLAIFLEENRSSGIPVEDWRALRRIYQRAEQEDPQNIDVLDSYGLWLTECAQVEKDPATQQEMYQEAEEALRRGLTKAPGDAKFHYSLGLNLYFNHTKSVTLAQREFEIAAERFAHTNPGDVHHCMAQLYVGHCLQDQKNWKGALEAYQKVDAVALASHWPRWRNEKRKEQMALCHLRLGEREAAQPLFEEVLSSYEALSPEDADELAFPDELVEAAVGELRAALYPRTRQMLEALGLLSCYPKALT